MRFFVIDETKKFGEALEAKGNVSLEIKEAEIVKKFVLIKRWERIHFGLSRLEIVVTRGIS